MERAAIPERRGQHAYDGASNDQPSNRGSPVGSLHEQVDRRAWEEAVARFDERATDRHVDNPGVMPRTHARKEDPVFLRIAET